MKNNNVAIIIRVFVGLVAWLLVCKIYGIFIDPMLQGNVAEILRMILQSMVVPYTVALGAFYLIVGGIPKESIAKKGSTQIGGKEIGKYFVIQTGVSFALMVPVNIICNIINLKTNAITSEELFGNIWFYLVLLLIFNPIMEEILFRKLILERISCLGTKGAIICSAVFFAVPHIISQGPAQMFYTFGLGLVWAYVTLKTGKLWPAVILHSLSNIYGAYLPMIASHINPILSVLFVMFTMTVMLTFSIIFVVKEKKVVGC